MSSDKRAYSPEGEIFIITTSTPPANAVFRMPGHEERLIDHLGTAVAKSHGVHTDSVKVAEAMALLANEGYRISTVSSINPTPDILMLDRFLTELDAHSSFFDPTRYTYRYYNPSELTVCALVLHDRLGQKLATIQPDKGAGGDGLLITVGAVSDFIESEHGDGYTRINSAVSQHFYLVVEDRDMQQAAGELAMRLAEENA